MRLDGIEFNFVCEIEPVRDGDGSIRYFMPQKRYSEANSASVHQFGWGPFCKFEISTDYGGSEGVFALKVDEKIKFIEETCDLDKKFNRGYGEITPENCFKDDKEDNCRINHNIFEEKRMNRSICLYFKETSNREKLKNQLIQKIEPEWNDSRFIEETGAGNKLGSESRAVRKRESVDFEGYNGKYLSLFNYLSNENEGMIELGFDEIEEILGFNLPEAARKHRAWWANSGHPQCKAWLKAGFRVDEIYLGDKIVLFKKYGKVN
ncbi:MAG: hypothetical protein BTN85_1622 [Candidatus Methanohalarchaeum thermophilum]|uniref:DUF7662 domain-containing protein n=1 Tax=Methanohalarchaeum thermophilum TaxID=1903181 RepID=A0A1Q6DXM3_METT1|nr:MAG: hypothetical protein BTN85_1622 [Candidatus Methanohalarchaeum thermophilum]